MQTKIFGKHFTARTLTLTLLDPFSETGEGTSLPIRCFFPCFLPEIVSLTLHSIMAYSYRERLRKGGDRLVWSIP